MVKDQVVGVQISSFSASSAKTGGTLAVVQHIIAEVTGNDIEDITVDADLEDDLGIDMMAEFPLIINKIQKQMSVKLPIAAVKDCVTIAELVELIDEELDL